MTKPVRRAEKSAPSEKTLNGSHKVTTDAKTHRAETFATNAITTITHANATSFNFGQFRILFSCWRTLEQVRIQKVFPRDRAPGYSNTVDIPGMGVQIYCNETLCSLFPIEGGTLQHGQSYHHFLLKHGDKEMMASVSIDIRPITKPTAAKYTRDVQFRAAFDAFRAKCEEAQNELQEEIERLLDVYADKVYASVPTEAPPARLPYKPTRIIARKAVGARRRAEG